MPCPEKFKVTLISHNITEEIRNEVNKGFESVVSSSPKTMKAEYFRRATEILSENCNIDDVHNIYEENACCKGGKREKESKAFYKKYSSLPLKEKLSHINEVPYMGKATLLDDNTLIVDAVTYYLDNKYKCACSNFNKLKTIVRVRKDYCYCCAGHFKHHYEIMLGVKLKTLEIVSSPLDSNGELPCVIKYRIL